MTDSHHPSDWRASHQENTDTALGFEMVASRYAWSRRNQPSVTFATDLRQDLDICAREMGAAIVLSRARSPLSSVAELLPNLPTEKSQLGLYGDLLSTVLEDARTAVVFAGQTLQWDPPTNHLSAASFERRTAAMGVGAQEVVDTFVTASGQMLAVLKHPALSIAGLGHESAFKTASQLISTVLIPKIGAALPNDHQVANLQRIELDVLVGLDAIDALNDAVARTVSTTGDDALPLRLRGALLSVSSTGSTTAELDDAVRAAKASSFASLALGFRNPNEIRSLLGAEPETPSHRYFEFWKLYQTGYELGLSESVLSHNSRRIIKAVGLET